MAASGLVLRVTHLDAARDGDAAERGDAGARGRHAARAGARLLGVAQQEISHFTADAGNHVDMELVRTEAGLIR